MSQLDQIPSNFQVGDLVQTQDGAIGIIIALYPIFEWGHMDYYVQINDQIEIYRAEELQPALLG